MLEDKIYNLLKKITKYFSFKINLRSVANGIYEIIVVFTGIAGTLLVIASIIFFIHLILSGVDRRVCLNRDYPTRWAGLDSCEVFYENEWVELEFFLRETNMRDYKYNDVSLKVLIEEKNE